MRLKPTLLLAAVYIAMSVDPAFGTPPEVVQELKTYYQDREKAPAWQDAIKRLSSDDGGQQATAAAYLRDLLDQSLEDELSGTVRWHATPFWGGPAENPARQLRQYVADALAKAPAAPAAVPVVRWFLDREKVARFQETALEAVTKAEGKEADGLLTELVSKPHPNAVVVVKSLKEVGRRKVTVSPQVLDELCQHYRRSIRDAARAVNSQLGRPEPPALDPVKAVQSEPIRKLMDEIKALILDPPAADTPFVKATTRTQDGDEWSTLGWVVAEDDDSCVILTTHGSQERFWKNERHRLTTRLDETPLGDWVERVVSVRADGNKEYELSDMGGLTGQFEGHGATLTEIVLAERLYARKQFAEAARVLLPALDTLSLDEYLVDVARDRLGDAYGHQMLGAFAASRDYDTALKVARHIADHLAHTRFHAEAVRLLDELPRRRDDYKELRLPTPQEWAEEKKKLSRKEQIDYLCRRLRLLRCVQRGQPGGISYTDRQYAEPPDFAGARTEVINPYVELVGSGRGDHHDIDAVSDGLGLTGSDVRYLAEHLREDWYIPSVSYWRNFHPQRELHHTREVVAYVIEEVAPLTFCGEKKFDAMTPEELDAQIGNLRRWGELGSVTGILKALLLLALLLGILTAFAKLARRRSRVRRPSEPQERTSLPP
jgi:hypothetical protein